MCSRHCAPVMDTASTIVAYLPPHLDSMLDSWATVLVNVCNWRNDFANDSLPSESFIAAVQGAHFAPLSGKAH
ncbi:unnamed protein product [Ixodes pacificus]